MDEIIKCECLGYEVEGMGFHHNSWCSKGASIERVSDSMKRDPERWIEGYVERNTEQVRRRALAYTNGHG